MGSDFILICRGAWNLATVPYTCQGTLLSVQSGLTFEPSMLDIQSVLGAIGSGFIIASVPLLVIMGCRFVLSPLFSKKR